MADLIPTAFVEFVRDKQLVTPAQVQELRQLQAQFPEVRALAGELVRRGWLTPYQANQLLQGHGSELVLGPYRILERLGEGGMGQVFKARHVRMDRLIALKVIAKEHLAGRQAVERFTREARAAAQLSHPNIVVAHDADEVGNRHFLAMEHVEGTDLARLVKQSGPLPIAQACDYIRQAALGMQHAHERGVVHRDIKPSNLMVTRAGPGAAPVVKILDFGLARFESESARKTRLTHLGSLMGTVDYIAPEQADNARNADIRSDIYSLGCSLFYLLTGKPPFPGQDAVTKVVARLVDKPPSARALRPDIPPALDAVVAKMMGRVPAQRHQAPAEVASALESFTKLKEPAPTSSRQLPAKDTAHLAATLFEGSRISAPVKQVRGKDNVWAAATSPRITTGSRAWQRGVRRHWPMLAAASGLLVLAVVLAAVLHRWSGSVSPEGKGSADSRIAFQRGPEVQKPKAKAPAEAADGKSNAETKIAPDQTSPEVKRPKGTAPTEPPGGKSGGDTKIESQTSPEVKKLKGKALTELPDEPLAQVLPTGEPLSPRALVRQPAGLKGVRTWTIERRMSQANPPISDYYAVAWSPDGSKIAYSGEFNSVGLWDENADRPFRDLVGHKEPVNSLAWSRDGNTLASGTGPRIPDKPRFWDVDSGMVKQIVNGHGDGWTWSPDFSYLAAYRSPSPVVAIFGRKSGKVIFALKGHTGPPPLTCTAWSPDSKTLATSGRDGTVRLWGAGSGKQLHKLVHAATDVWCVAWSPDGKSLASGAGHSAYIWDAKSAKLIRTLDGHGGNVGRVAWSPDGMQLATDCGDPTCRIWEATTGKALRALGQAGLLSWSPDGRTLATRGLATKGDASILFWDTHTGQLRATLLRFQNGEGLVVSAAGHYRATPGMERELVYVTQTDRGQETLTPEDFGKQYGWKNDPKPVSLAGK
jgi:serine/threonine protein kinase/WD40 repeat protein